MATRLRAGPEDQSTCLALPQGGLVFRELDGYEQLRADPNQSLRMPRSRASTGTNPRSESHCRRARRPPSVSVSTRRLRPLSWRTWASSPAASSRSHCAYTCACGTDLPLR